MLHDLTTGRFTGPSKTAEQRYWPKVKKTDKCWIWTASKNNRGYGIFWDGNRLVCAHRFSYELANGSIPLGLDLDHLCRNPSCVRPDHLDPVTHQENASRGENGLKSGLQQRAKTHCPSGHPYDQDNTYINPTTKARHCRICRSAQKRDPAADLDRSRAYQDRKRKIRLTMQADRKCEHCCAPMPHGRADKRFCSKRCLKAKRTN